MNDNQKTTSSFPVAVISDPALIRRRAGLLLKRKDVRISLAVSLLAVLAAFFLGNYIPAAAAEFLIYDVHALEIKNEAVADLAVDCLSLFFGILLSLPLIAGYRREVAGVSVDGYADMRLLFSSFSSPKRFFSDLFRSFISYLPVISAAAIYYFIVFAITLTDPLKEFPSALYLAVILLLLPLYVFMYMTDRHYLLIIAESSENPLPPKFRMPAGLYFRLLFRSVAGYLFSILTLGILYFIHFGPLFALERAESARLFLNASQAGENKYNLTGDFIYE